MAHWKTIYRNRRKRVQVLPGRSPPVRPRSAPRSDGALRVQSAGMNLGEALTLCWYLVVFLVGVYVWVVLWEVILVGLVIAVFIYIAGTMKV